MSIELIIPPISSSVTLFSCPQSFPASESFPISQPFISVGQNIGALALASVLPLNIQGWFPLGLTHLISFLSKGLSRVFSSTTVWRDQFFGAQPSLWSNSYLHTWLLEKLTLTMQTLLVKWCLCFLICCLVCQSFLSKEQASFNFMAAVTIHSDFGAQENEICHCFDFFPIYLPCMIIVFELWVLTQLFTLLFHFHQEAL